MQNIYYWNVRGEIYLNPVHTAAAAAAAAAAEAAAAAAAAAADCRAANSFCEKKTAHRFFRILALLKIRSDEKSGPCRVISQQA